MEISIKQLQQNEQIFFPQTVSEAVLVKEGSTIITLNNILERKLEQVETPIGSGLQSYKQNKSVIITHANQIEPNENLQPLQVKYDSRGHIMETKPLGKTVVTVDNNLYSEIDGSSDNYFMFGDDFNIDNRKIILKWNNI